MNNQIVTGKILKDKILEAIDLLCDPVKLTLGPKGRNVIINGDYRSPLITNDGVTIASSICSDDDVINTILTIAKEAAIKTNEVVGDGTTSTLVLFQKLYENGIKTINEGYSSMILKKEMLDAIPKIISCLERISINCDKKHLKHIADISANDNEIGHLVYSTYNKVDGGVIKLIETSNSQTTSEIIKGYYLENGLASPYLFNNKDSITLDNPYLLITNGVINDIETITNIINELIEIKKTLIIVAEDFSNELLENISVYNYQNDLNIACIKAPNYGDKKINILYDLSIIGSTKVYDENKGDYLSELLIKDLGRLSKSIINKESSIMLFNNNEKIKLRKKELTKKLKNENDEFEREFIINELASMNKGMGIIYVGGSTKTEMVEKKMRYEDAICALKSTDNKKILPGCGVSYLIIKDQYKVNNKGEEVIVNSLSSVFSQIITNVGINEKIILDELKKSNYSKTYNVLTNKYVLVSDYEVIDSLNVNKQALINAVSIAGMMLTTDALVINKPIKDIKDVL